MFEYYYQSYRLLSNAQSLFNVYDTESRVEGCRTHECGQQGIISTMEIHLISRVCFLLITCGHLEITMDYEM